MQRRPFGGARRTRGGRSGMALPTVLLFSLLACSTRSLSAQNLPEVRDAELTSRIEVIQDALDRGKPAVDRWWYGWTAAYGAATGVQTGVLLQTDDPRQREDMAVGALTSMLGVAGQVVFPLHAGRFATKLHDMPESTLEERREKLQAAESYLRTAAEEERFGRSWKSRLLSLSVNATAGLVTSLAFDRPVSDGVIVFGIGQAVSEVQLLTQPTRAIHDLEAYVKGTRVDRFTPDGRPHATWSVAVGPSRLSLTRRF